eukprot:CAMPEP_0116076366 /NCGR_PEP_ID=MMETSP0322-20121206/17214_1 /TAXON_ID=163516 /ORGANISM="Leptocylindrus danicus var. apora, Strain B651" /LENGTH=708 /DNA_ID=CAMNT_0003566655 /DNA_START=197 /DNA_END=2323 /DNA_ORIENTATION=+
MLIGNSYEFLPSSSSSSSSWNNINGRGHRSQVTSVGGGRQTLYYRGTGEMGGGGGERNNDKRRRNDSADDFMSSSSSSSSSSEELFHYLQGDEASKLSEWKDVPFDVLPFSQMSWIPESTSQLEALKVSELRLACQQRRLPKSGTKAKLIERLRNWSVLEAQRLVYNRERREAAKEILRTENTVLLSKQRQEVQRKSETRDVELDTGSLYNEAKRREMKGDIDGAKATLRKLLKLTPEDGRVVRRIARMSSPLEAKQVLQESLRKYPNNGYLWHGLAQLSMEYDSRQAKAYYKKGCANGCVNSFHALGGLEFKEGNVQEAAKLFRKGIKLFPENHRLYHALGSLQIQAGLYNQALTSFKQGLKYAPNYGKSFMMLGLSYLEYQYNDDILLAKYYVKEAVKANPMFERGWLALALLDDNPVSVYQRAILTYEGLQRGKRSRATKNKWASVYQALASRPELTGRESYLVLKKASQLFSDDWIVWFNLAKRCSSKTRSIAAFERCLEVAGDCRPEPYQLYAEYLISKGDTKEARRLFLRAATHLRSGKGLSKLYHSWSLLEMSTGNLSRADKLLDLSLQCLPRIDPKKMFRDISRRTSQPKEVLLAKEKAEILFEKAKLSDIMGDKDKSRNLVSQCLCYDPTMSSAWEFWSKLVESDDESLAAEIRSQANIARRGVIDVSGVRQMGKTPWENVYNIGHESNSLKSLVISQG